MRLATYDDIPALVAMGGHFYQQTEQHKAGMVFDDDKAAIVARMCIDNGVLLIEDGKGMLAMLVTEGLWSSDLMAFEVAFYVSPEARDSGIGKKLLKEGMKIARSRGVKMFSMINMECLEPEKSAAMYRSAGLNLTETTFTKAL